MKTRGRISRALWIVLFGVVMAGTMGQQCTIGIPSPTPAPVPVSDTVDVELINNAPFTVDPGLFADGVAYIIDPPLAAGDSFTLTLDCAAGTTLQTDAALFDPAGAIPSDNVPLLTEGVDFTCGDVVTFVFTEDAAGFFTQVLVNGVLIGP